MSRRTDADRLADMQAELARLKAAGEAKALAVQETSTEAVSPKLAHSRTARARPKSKRVAAPASRDGDVLDSELRDLVEGFVSALRDVICRELIAQAKKRLS